MKIKIKRERKKDLIKDDDIIRMLSVGCRAFGDDLLHLYIFYVLYLTVKCSFQFLQF